MMAVTLEDFERARLDYENQKQVVASENNDVEIAEKVQAFEKALREEYAKAKQIKLREIEISIEAIERLKQRVQDIVILREE